MRDAKLAQKCGITVPHSPMPAGAADEVSAALDIGMTPRRGAVGGGRVRCAASLPRRPARRAKADHLTPVF